MARFQSNHAKRLITPPRPLSAGALAVARFDFTFSAAFAFATDQVELGILPAFCTIYDAVLIGNSGGANTANVGLMAGEIGDLTSANASRAVTANLFATTSINATVTRASLAGVFGGIAPVGYDRAIGFEATANIAASGSNNVSLILFYAM